MKNLSMLTKEMKVETLKDLINDIGLEKVIEIYGLEKIIEIYGIEKVERTIKKLKEK